jgi:hyperosmotically inducible protein
MTAGTARAHSRTQELSDRASAAAQSTGTYLSDTEITTAVKSKLLADKRVSSSRIHVETNDGVVALTGAVDTAAERTRATYVARHTRGVRRVEDHLTIGRHESNGLTDRSDEGVKGTSGRVERDSEGAARTTGRYFDDAGITSAVKAKLIGDREVHSMDVHVETDNRVVTLTGSVRSEAERANAVRLARDTSGVKSVVDKLTVK